MRFALVTVSRAPAPGRRFSSAPGDDVDHPAARTGAELNGAGGECEQGVVLAAADVDARVEVGAALPNDDLAGVDLLAAEALHAQALRVGVTAVAAGRRALFVCHGRSYFPVSMPVTLTRLWR